MTNRAGILIVAAQASRRQALQKIVRHIAGDEPIVLSASLSPGFLQENPAEVLIVDIEGPAQAASVLRAISDSPPAGWVVLADDPDPAWVRQALRSGVNSILARDAVREDLQLALQAAEAGLVLLHPTSAHSLLASDMTALDFQADYAPLEQLTLREREVLRWMSAGLGNKEIALRLGISEHTVKFHASSILGKLGATSRTEAVSRGIRRGLIPL